MKKILIGIGAALLIVIIAGMYKFNYLANLDGYDIDGNKITAEKSSQNIRSISPVEFQNLAESGEYVIIDIRTPAELLPENGGQLFDEILNIDFYKPDFRENLAKLDPDENYLIYCRSGSRSGKTLKIMKEMGFKNVANLDGGRNAWLRTFK